MSDINKKIDDLFADIELPSDEEVHKETWTKKRSENPVWRKSLLEQGEERSKNPVWRARNREAVKKTTQNPEWKKKVQENIKKLFSNPVYAEQHRERTKKWSNTPEHRARIKEMQATEEWKEANRRGAEKRRGRKVSDETRAKIRAIHSDPEHKKKQSQSVLDGKGVYIKTPTGVYQGFIAAAESMKVGTHSIGRYIVKHPHLFSRITEEEYLKLQNDTKFQNSLLNPTECVALIKAEGDKKRKQGCIKRSANPEYREKIKEGWAKRKKNS